jgi:hypothetical protein
MDQALRWARRLRSLSWWSLHPDTELGVRLLARGFAWGWEPHWMALDLARLPEEESPHPVAARGALAHGADPTVRDRMFGATALGWAEHLGHERLAARLAPLSP